MTEFTDIKENEEVNSKADISENESVDINTDESSEERENSEEEKHRKWSDAMSAMRTII